MVTRPLPEPGRPLAVLIGPMGAGKTRIGKRIARALDVPFTDSDRVIVDAHGPITEIFAAEGEDAFRAMEHDVIAAALAHTGILSLGGGAVTHPTTRALLADHRIVYLTVDEDAVLARINTDKRPLLRDDPGAWRRIFEGREAHYRALATVVHDTSHVPIDRVAADIAEWLKEQENIA